MVLGIPAGGATFDENFKYVYYFSGNTTIIAPTEDSNGVSEVSITGRAYVIGTKNCGAIIYLKNVEITHGSKVILNSVNILMNIYFVFKKGYEGLF